MPSSACRYRPPRPPGQRVAKRNARKEEFVKCDFAPRSKMHRTAGINYQACCAPRRVRRRASQTRRHPLTPTPVQQLCTHVQSCGQKRSFLLDRARPVFFSTRWKRKWGVHPRWTSPLREQTPPWPPFGGPSAPYTAERQAAPVQPARHPTARYSLIFLYNTQILLNIIQTVFVFGV